MSQYPLLIDHYLEDAIEVDVDAIADQQDVVVAGIMEHVEMAGIHSGDSACSLPPHSLSQELIDEITHQTIALGKALGVVGLMNIQFAVQQDQVYVLEVNPRASRTVPFRKQKYWCPPGKIGHESHGRKNPKGIEFHTTPIVHPHVRQRGRLSLHQAWPLGYSTGSRDAVDWRSHGH